MVEMRHDKRQRRWAETVILAFCLVYVVVSGGGSGGAVLLFVAAGYSPGEHIPAAWRGSVLDALTDWNDISARGCPQFARDTKSVLIVPEPLRVSRGQGKHTQQPFASHQYDTGSDRGGDKIDGYKILFGIDFERYQTTWLHVINLKNKLEFETHIVNNDGGEWFNKYIYFINIV